MTHHHQSVRRRKISKRFCPFHPIQQFTMNPDTKFNNFLWSFPQTKGLFTTLETFYGVENNFKSSDDEKVNRLLSGNLILSNGWRIKFPRQTGLWVVATIVLPGLFSITLSKLTDKNRNQDSPTLKKSFWRRYSTRCPPISSNFLSKFTVTFAQIFLHPLLSIDKIVLLTLLTRGNS